MIDSLMQLGLSRTEAEIYQALVNTGPCFVAPLVRLTGKHRQVVYNALDSLQKSGLISVSKKNGKRFYSVANPDRFVFDVRKKQVVADELAKHITARLSSDREYVEMFGPESHAEALADSRRHAEEAGEFLGIRGESQEWFPFTKPFFMEHVEDLQRMRRLGVNVCILLHASEQQIAETFFGPHIGNPYTVKVLPDEFRLPHTLWVAGECCYILTPVSEPLVIRIKSASLSEQYRNYFWTQWKRAELLRVN